MPLPKRAKTTAGGSAGGEAGSAEGQSDERETWDEAASVALVRQYMEKGMHTLVPKAHGMGERGTKGARWTAISAGFEQWCNANGYRLAVTVRSLTHRLKMMKNKFRQLEPLAATQPAVVAEIGERLWPALREVVHSEDAIRMSASEAAEAVAQQQHEQQQLGKQSEAESMPHPTPLQLNEAPLQSNGPVSTAAAASASTTAPPPLPALAPPHGGHGGHQAALLISSGVAAGGHGNPVHLNSPARPDDGGRQGGRMQAPAPMYSQTRMGPASGEASAGGGNAELGVGLGTELLNHLQRLSSQLLASEEENRRLLREMHAEKMKMLDTMIQRTEQSNARLLERVMDELAAARAGDRN